MARLRYYVALLRGVNVGRGQRVPMASFRALLEAQGCVDVRTLLNSGNAVFASAGGTAASHAQAIHAALLRELGLTVPVVVKSADDFLSALEASRLVAPEVEDARVLLAFWQSASATSGLMARLSELAPAERPIMGRHALYLPCPDGILESKAGKALLGKTGALLTTRNRATALKIAAPLIARVETRPATSD